MSEVLLGIDLGSTATKVIALDRATGGVRSLRQAACLRFTPAPGWLEIDAEATFHEVLQLIREVSANDRRSVVAIGLAGQMTSLVLVSREGRALARCQSIFDTRCTKEVETLDAWAEELLAKERNRALTVHTVAKLLWLAHHQPELLAKAHKFVLLKDYVRGRMTGVWATDASDASGTLLYDQCSGAWDVELMGALGLSPQLCVPVAPASRESGRLLARVAQRCGLPSGVPVATGAADMAALQVGVGAGPGDTVISVGTAAHVIAPANELKADLWPVQQYTNAIPGSYYKFGAVFSGGLALDWFRSLIGFEWQDAYYADAAERDSGTCPLFMPYLLGAGSPHYTPGAAGAFTGLHLTDGRAVLAAAVVDGLALETLGVVEAVQPDLSRVYLTGGASRLPLVASTLAAVLGRPLERTVSSEAAAIGAARLGDGALHGGEVLAPPMETVTVEPDLRAVEFYQHLRPRYQEVARVVREF